MKPQGINRVVIAVKDLDKAVALYSRLLGTAFHFEEAAAEPLGVRAALSWEAGIELCSPLPSRDSIIKRFMDQHGEGLVSVVFCVDDVEEARAAAEDMGIRRVATIEFDQDQIKQLLADKFKKFKEYMFDRDDTFGTNVLVAQIEPK